MVATLCLLSCVLATAQPPVDRSEWLLAPHLAKAQELVYQRGTYVEEALGSVQSQRGYRIDCRMLVLDSSPQGFELAVLTTLKPREQAAEGARESAALSVRLEIVKFDAQGRIVSEQSSALAAPFDGPPTIELGCFLEVPRTRVSAGKKWDVTEDGRPLRTWQVVGTELLGGTTCVKLTGTQQSEHWTTPRADDVAWRRRDTVWIGPRLGIAQKVERVIERRDPGHTEPTHRSTVTYELTGQPLQWPAQLFEDRQHDIQQARAFWDAAVPLMANPARYAAQLDNLLARINHHLEQPSPTPYREAVVRVKKRVEAAKRGEALVTTEPAAVPSAAVVAVGKPAPDFVTPDFVTRESARLKNWQGKAIVLVFYNPASDRAADILRFAQQLARAHANDLAVLGLAMSEDGDKVRAQRAELLIKIPVLSGTGLRVSYAVDTTPKMVIIDRDGIVRGTYAGWGLEIQEDLAGELKHWLPPTEPVRK